MATDKQIIREIMKRENLTPAAFLKQYPQIKKSTLYDLLKGTTKKLSPKNKEVLKTVYDEIKKIHYAAAFVKRQSGVIKGTVVFLLTEKDAENVLEMNKNDDVGTEFLDGKIFKFSTDGTRILKGKYRPPTVNDVLAFTKGIQKTYGATSLYINEMEMETSLNDMRRGEINRETTEN